MVLKHIKILESVIYSNNCPNLIIYGIKDIQKLDLLLFLLKKINNTPVKIINDKIKWESNVLYKIFNMEYITNKNISDFFIILYDLINSKNYYSKNNIKIIILNNFNQITYNIQNKLRVIIEKYRLVAIFILITDKITSIINPIQSRCLSIRVPSLSIRGKRELSNEIINDLPYYKKSIIYDKIYKINNNNEIKYYSEFNEGLFLKYKTIYEKIYNKIITISEKEKLNQLDIENIREISYSIEKYNLYNIYEELLCLLINDPKYIFNIKIKIIELFATSEYNYQKSYRSLIHIENLFIQLIHLLR